MLCRLLHSSMSMSVSLSLSLALALAVSVSSVAATSVEQQQQHQLPHGNIPWQATKNAQKLIAAHKSKDFATVQSRRRHLPLATLSLTQLLFWSQPLNTYYLFPIPSSRYRYYIGAAIWSFIVYENQGHCGTGSNAPPNARCFCGIAEKEIRKC